MNALAHYLPGSLSTRGLGLSVSAVSACFEGDSLVTFGHQCAGAVCLAVDLACHLDLTLDAGDLMAASCESLLAQDGFCSIR